MPELYQKRHVCLRGVLRDGHGVRMWAMPASGFCGSEVGDMKNVGNARNQAERIHLSVRKANITADVICGCISRISQHQTGENVLHGSYGWIHFELSCEVTEKEKSRKSLEPLHQ
jgi:hypothetical protein